MGRPRPETGDRALAALVRMDHGVRVVAAAALRSLLERHGGRVAPAAAALGLSEPRALRAAMAVLELGWWLFRRWPDRSKGGRPRKREVPEAATVNGSQSSPAPSAPSRDLTGLADMFPSVRALPGPRPWTGLALLDAYYGSRAGEIGPDVNLWRSLRFVLALMAPKHRPGRDVPLPERRYANALREAAGFDGFSGEEGYDVRILARDMDQEHRAAVAAWLLAPWFPAEATERQMR